MIHVRLSPVMLAELADSAERHQRTVPGEIRYAASLYLAQLRRAQERA